MIDILDTIKKLATKPKTMEKHPLKELFGEEKIMEFPVEKPEIKRITEDIIPVGEEPKMTFGQAMKIIGNPKVPKESREEALGELAFTVMGMGSPIKKIGVEATKKIIRTRVREKAFLQTIKKSAETTGELKKAVGDLTPTYQVFTNKEAMASAEKILKKGINRAKEKVLSIVEPPSAEKSALTIRLIKKYEAKKDVDTAINLVESYDKQLREAGRYVQAASLWNKLSPVGMIRFVERQAKKFGKKLAEDAKKIIFSQMKNIQKMPEGVEKDKATMKLMNYIAEQFPPTKIEILDAYRYQNMLSSPRTQERNIHGGIFNTFMTRPLDMLATATYDLFRHPFNPAARDMKFRNIPQYYQEVFKTIPEALIGAKEAFRRGDISLKILETGKAESAIELLRRRQIPKSLTIVPRFMEAQDRFFSILIGAGEKARLLEKGIKIKKAEKLARDLAEKYLYRETLGKAAKDEAQPLIVRALDSLGVFALRGRKIIGIGKVYEWMVPFIRTPINIAKMQVERSPLGFVGGSMESAQMAKATLGSVITGMGAILALQDKTSWLPPTNPKDKEYFYASGRKAMSVQIGDNWVPMWYFGPYALALALPAAIKHYQSDTKEALTDNDFTQILEGIASNLKFITEQTPLTGMSNFLKALEGDIDYTLPANLGFTAEQLIPAAGLIRYINTILDPIYKKAPGFFQAIQKDLPFLSQTLEPHKTPTGEPARRELSSYLAPWDIGTGKSEFEQAFQQRLRAAQFRAVETKRKKEIPRIMTPTEWKKSQGRIGPSSPSEWKNKMQIKR